MSPAPRLLIFDWDGTLMDSVANIVATLNQAVADLDLDSVEESAIRGTIGLGLRETLDVLFPAADDALCQRIVECYGDHWRETYRHRCLLFPGALETIVELGRQGHLLAVATGKGRRGLDHDLAQTGLGEVFDATRTADEARSKPDPQMLFHILDDLGESAAGSLMIGDTTHDLEMARHAGMPALAVTSGSHPRAWLEPLEPVACLESVVDLPGWLGREHGDPIGE